MFRIYMSSEALCILHRVRAFILGSLLLPVSVFGAAGDMSVSGTVTAGSFVGDGSGLSNLSVTQSSGQSINVDIQLTFSTSLTAIFDQVVYEVPLGKRYVIETISVGSTLSGCAFYLIPTISTSTGGEYSEFRLPVPSRYYSSEYSGYHHNGTWPIKLYADPGTSVYFSTQRTEPGCTAYVRFSATGYLEDY